MEDLVTSSSSSSLLHRVPVSIGRNQQTVFTAGRPPWYQRDGSPMQAFVIGCAGGSASGKTSVAEELIRHLDIPWVVLLSMDSFYKNLNKSQLELAHRSEYNFDHPDAFDFDLVYKTLQQLKAGKQVEVPEYDFTKHQRAPETKILYGASVVVFEGIFALYDQKIVELMDMKIFVDTDDDVRLARRLKRDITERGRDLKGVLAQYSKFVKPAFDQYIRPCLLKADVIIPRGGGNHVAIDMIGKNIKSQLEKRGFKFRADLAHSLKDTKEIPPNVKVLRSTNQLKILHTIIRDQTTNRDDFIFYSNRLFRLLIEDALSELSFVPKTVLTPTNSEYEGRVLSDSVCGVSIIRAGGALESALQHIQQDVSIGKILIQTDMETGEPTLHYCKLPKRVHECKILLMDATIATGAAALMAIRILLDHGVNEQNIVFISIIAAPQGLHAIAYAFPRVRVVVSEVDVALNDKFHIIPGIGNFGDRFYGTGLSSDPGKDIDD